MRISYNPLWKMLIDKGMNKKELRELAESAQLLWRNWVRERTLLQMYYLEFALR